MKTDTLQITLNDRRKLHAIQEEFNTCFPYLKLEFFSKPHKAGGPSSRKLMKAGGHTIGEARTVHKKGHITIHPQMTVTELEQRFSDIYGLHLQLFRKSGRVWLETSITDGWTLEEQNNQGEALSKMV